ncbi:MAG TPA: CHASE4 domain-containing protein [Methanospirillum sp.]|uniref:CHASE4 domain-containing protein n=1 Tax=Methanospirillum sp. TaxID=45200 RepID=UPI002B78433B|nr:CHASE4 domain-containing protein [Methanospirillum sp.]HPY59469.1 CHASE4 domain-containing protein [Methanospirillum sp.]
MRLYPKMILIIACTFFALMSLLLFSFEFTIMDSFSSLEEKYTGRDLTRAYHAIEDEIRRLQQVATDWGEWDDTYNFVFTHDQEYVSSNLAPSTFEALNIAFYVVQDLSGTTIVSRGLSEQDGPLTNAPSGLVSALTWKGKPPGEMKSGLVEWNHSAWIFAQNPVLTSHRGGPSRGTVTVLNKLDIDKLSEISDSLLQNITIRVLTADEKSGGEYLGKRTEMTGGSVLASDVLHDYKGMPFLLLQVKSDRELYERGLLTRNYLFFSLLLLALCFMGVAVTLINLVVIAPLSELNAELLKVGQTGLLSGRIKTGRNDEIGDLGRSINQMLDQIERAVEQRHATEQRLSRLIALAEEGICLVGPDRRIWFANPKLASIFGRTPVELNGMFISELLDGETFNADELHGDRSVQHEMHARKKDGTEIYIRVVSAPYPLDSSKEGHLFVISDITTFKDNEKELLLLNKKLSLLGSMTRHDIVNQLTTIRGMLGLVHRKTDDEVILNLIETAEEAADRVNKHIEFSKEYQKAGMQVPVWQNLQTCWSLAYAMTRKKGLTFTYDGKNYEVFADQLLQKVFYNLIDNSLKHGKSVFYIMVHTRVEDGNLVIIYEDDGEGIQDSMKERVFERGVGSGTGWGLFFVREVLGLTGITITEEGTFGIGAKFLITVPEGGYRQLQQDQEEKV